MLLLLTVHTVHYFLWGYSPIFLAVSAVTKIYVYIVSILNSSEILNMQISELQWNYNLQQPPVMRRSPSRFAVPAKRKQHTLIVEGEIKNRSIF